MFVDQDNFKDQKQRMLDQIKQCEFIGLDLEMTGIKGECQDFQEELLVERYMKMRKVSMKFTIVQFGLCLFMKEQDGYSAYPYTVYLFPQDQDVVVGLQIGSIQFNNKYGMDWNRWIRKGIGYLNEQQMQKLEIQYQDIDKNNNQLDQLIKDMKQEEQQYMEHLFQSIDKFSKSNDNQTILQTKNGYQRKIVHTYLEQQFKLILGESQIGEAMKLIKFTPQQREEYEAQKQQAKEEKKNQRIGFTAIWQAIVDSKKPIIGHNCFADVLFLFSHFIGCPPVNMDKFKKDVRDRLPLIVDTKYTIKCAPSLQGLRDKIDTSTSLQNLADFVKDNTPQIKIKSNIKENQYHTAGFDAYMTGYVYLHLLQLLNKEDGENILNKLMLFRCNYHLNLIGQNIKALPIENLYVKLPYREADLKTKLKSYEKEIEEINKSIEKYGSVSKLIHTRYLYMQFTKEQYPQAKGELEKIVQTFPNCSLYTELQYISERIEQKEKEAKYDQFDKK